MRLSILYKQHNFNLFSKRTFILLSFFLILSFIPSFTEAISFPNKIDTPEERKNIQTVLNTVMTPSPNLAVDGIIGKKSIKAIKDFQESQGLIIDGIVGPITRSALNKTQIDNQPSVPVITDQTLFDKAGCFTGSIFSITTGQRCKPLPAGCIGNSLFSTTTGMDCSKSVVISNVILNSSTTISTPAISGITAPVTGATPTSTITDTSEYTATISWSPADATFSSNTIYTATITITPKSGYTLTGVSANFFTVSGATATNSINSGTVTAVFPVTATTIATAAIAGITAPVTDATPTATIADTSEYTATISWSPTDSPFLASTVYTATITITPKSGYTLTGITENFFTVSGATATNPANSGVVTAVFPATEASYVTEYQTVYDAMTTKPGDTYADAQNTMVESLVTAGYWARMDLFYVFAQESNTNSEALINWKNPGTFNAVNQHETAWTSLEGFTGDGASDYIDTNWNAGLNAINFTLDSGTISVYERLDIVNREQYDIGARDLTQQISLTSNYGDTAYTRVNGTTAISASNTDSTGLYIGTRRSSTNLELYRNGSSIVESTSNNSSSIPGGTATLNILAREGDGGSRDFHSTNQISIAFVMNGISDAEASEITTIINTYMTTIGKNVF